MSSKSLRLVASLVVAGAVGSWYAHADDRKPDSPQWLGVFLGAEIPGYKTVKSQIIISRGWHSADQMLRPNVQAGLAENLVKDCKEILGGVAIINRRTVVALGAVPSSVNSNVTVEQGLFREYEGECVTEAERLRK